MQTLPPIAFHRELSRTSVRAILDMPAEAQAIADRWALTSPTRLRRFEADGSLLQRLKEQYALERAALERAKGEDYAHLAEHEKLEIFGPPGGL